MPDHIRMDWIGLSCGSDQLYAMKHFRPRCNESLGRIGFELQDQSHDHVLQDEERGEGELHDLCEYIARNPERAGLIKPDDYAEYPYNGCLIPGYPEMRPFAPNFWDRFDKTCAHLRKNGFQQLGGSGRGDDSD